MKFCFTEKAKNVINFFVQNIYVSTTTLYNAQPTQLILGRFFFYAILSIDIRGFLDI
mgnify:FL=1